MTVYLYTLDYDSHVLNKQLPSEGFETISTVTPYEPVSDIRGYIIINYDSTRMARNYAVFDDKRYYIESKEKAPGGQLRLNLMIDALSTYMTEILNIDVIPERSEDQYNSWICDTSQPFEVAKDNYIMNPTGYSSSLPDACLDYSKLSLICGIVGTDEPTNNLPKGG